MPFLVLALVATAAFADDPEYMSPLARKLSRSELDDVERLIALKTAQPIVAICGVNNPLLPGYGDRFLVVTATPGRPRNRDIECYELERKNHGWRFIHVG